MQTKQAERDAIEAKLEHAHGNEESATATMTTWHNRLAAICTSSLDGPGESWTIPDRARRFDSAGPAH
jgi:hypothetical protein